MNKHAYNLGVKLALAEIGLAQSPQPAEVLATILQNEPKTDGTPRISKRNDRAIGEPENPNSEFSGAPSANYSGDVLWGLGLDVRGPESTGI